MATTTPNFGWVVPTSTDLVKDGATAIETLGDSIDASLLDLKGGTSGQVLAKNSNTDMDFVWVAQDDSNAIQNAIVDAKGDLIAATAADTPARLAIGTNGQVLTADSTAATGIKWAAAAGGSMTLLSTTSLSGTSTTVSSIVGGYRDLYIYGADIKTTSGTAALKLTWNGFTVGTYGTIIAAGAYAAFTNTRISNAAGIIDPATGRASMNNAGALQFIFNAREYTGTTGFRMVDGWIAPTYSEDYLTFGAFNDTNSNAITSFTVTTAAGTESLTGTIKVYGVN